MAVYDGYVTLPISTYDAFRDAVNGNGYNADGYYGCQCWHLVAELWFNIGFPTNYPLTGPNQAAYECWTVNRNNNIATGGETYFDLIDQLSQVKRGDVIVLNYTDTNPAGHIAFADEDYNGTTTLRCLGQNQGSGEPTPGGGSTANIQDIILQPQNWGAFLGAFRYRAWQDPEPTHEKSKFPFVLRAAKRRRENL